MQDTFILNKKKQETYCDENVENAKIDIFQERVTPHILCCNMKTTLWLIWQKLWRKVMKHKVL